MHQGNNYQAHEKLADGVKPLLGMAEVDVNNTDRHGRTPLSIAVENGCLNIVKLLLIFRSPIDIPQSQILGNLGIYVYTHRKVSRIEMFRGNSAHIDG